MCKIVTHFVIYISDEVALVTATAKLGIELISRKGDSVEISIFGKSCQYEILNILEFNSYRKRMSIICRDPVGTLRLYSKGADSVIFPRLVFASYNYTTQTHVDAFARGMKT